jgi:hypothetical protein
MPRKLPNGYGGTHANLVDGDAVSERWDCTRIAFERWRERFPDLLREYKIPGFRGVRYSLRDIIAVEQKSVRLPSKPHYLKPHQQAKLRELEQEAATL